MRKESRYARPQLQQLEARLAPAAYVVDLLADVVDANDNKLSLREAMTAANARPATEASTITFAATLSGTVNLGSALPALDRNITLTGLGSASTTIKRDAAVMAEFRVFAVNAGKTVTLKDLTVANGKSAAGTDGGGIHNQGNLTLDGVIVKDNMSARHGGGVYTVTGRLTLKNTIIDNNEATAGNGGGIYAKDDVDLNNVQVTNNKAKRVNNEGGDGGGIYTEGAVTQLDPPGAAVIVRGNRADQNGGGIYIGTGGVLDVFRRGRIDQNQAPSGRGGGIYNSAGGSIGALNNSLLAGNRANQGGGALYNAGTATLKNVTGSGNATLGGGGTMHAVTGSTLNAQNVTVTGTTVLRLPPFPVRPPGPQGLASGQGAEGLSAGPVEPPPEEPAAAVFVEPGATAELWSSLIAGNSGGPTPDVYGQITSLGHNLIGIQDGGSGYDATDLLGTFSSPLDPRLGPLGDYGGDTLVHLLLSDSPALNAGDNSAATATDQRGLSRIVGGTIDIGAVEMQASDWETPSATLNGSAWQDSDGDGLQGAGEPGLAGVLVYLLDADGNQVGQAVTDSTGQYRFEFVLPGSYSLAFVAPAGYAFSPQDQGSDDALDSDADASGFTDLFTLLAGTNRTDLDAGLVPQG